MFKLLKLGVILVLLAALAYFAFFIELGQATLYEHLVGIAGTQEAQALGDELEKKAVDISQEVAAKVPQLADDEAAPQAATVAPLSEISEADRDALDKLVKKKNK